MCCQNITVYECSSESNCFLSCLGVQLIQTFVVGGKRLALMFTVLLLRLFAAVLYVFLRYQVLCSSSGTWAILLLEDVREGMTCSEKQKMVVGLDHRPYKQQKKSLNNFTC